MAIRPAQVGDCATIAAWQATNPDWLPPGSSDWVMCITAVGAGWHEFVARGPTGSSDGRDGSAAVPMSLMFDTSYGRGPYTPPPAVASGEPPPSWWYSELVVGGRRRGVSNGDVVLVAVGAVVVVGGIAAFATRKKRGTSGIGRGMRVWG